MTGRRGRRRSLTDALRDLEANDAAVRRAARRLDDATPDILWRARSRVERRRFVASNPNRVELDANDDDRSEDHDERHS